MSISSAFWIFRNLLCRFGPSSRSAIGGVLLSLTCIACGDKAPVLEMSATIVDGPISITSLEVQHNFNNVLSCYVTWKTNVPTSSEVAFGTTLYQHRILDEALVTEHEVFVFGLRPAQTYWLRATAARGAQTASEEISYRTGVLPDVVQVPTLGVRDAARMQPGWTLTNNNDISVSPPSPPVAVIYDEDGYPVWYFIHGETPDTRGDVDVRYLEDEEIILIGPSYPSPAVAVDLAGNVVWTGPEYNVRNQMTHHMDKLSNGTYLTIRDLRETRDDGEFIGNRVVVFGADGREVWDWNIFDYVEPQRTGEWCHGNSVTLVPAEDVFYFSCRNRHTVYKISLSEPREIIWRLGVNKDFAPDPAAPYPWFAGQHDPELQENGNLLIYDNGVLGNHAYGMSRVLEYALDEETMTAEIVWEFPGEFEGVDSWYRDEWVSSIWGDADRLPNGNVLVAFGTRSEAGQSRIFEVTPTGEVVWELLMPTREKATGVYRAQRMARPSRIVSVE